MTKYHSQAGLGIAVLSASASLKLLEAQPNKLNYLKSNILVANISFKLINLGRRIAAPRDIKQNYVKMQ